MARIKYVSGIGTEYDLSSFHVRLRQKTAGFMHYEWTPLVTEKVLGVEVDSFGKDPAQYEMTVDFKGDARTRAQKAQEFYEVTEKDVRARMKDRRSKPGRLYYNDSYIECFITASEPVTYENSVRKVGKKFTVYAPYPFWLEEKTYILQKFETSMQEAFLDFEYDFLYDLSSERNGVRAITNDNFDEAEFRITIYGPATNPSVTIDGATHRVNTVIQDGEYLEIISKDGQVTRVTASGKRINEVNKRAFKDDKANDVFKKIPPGTVNVSWSGEYKADITILGERSEPRWS